MRLLGLDIGRRRIGVAISSGILATPLMVLTIDGNIDPGTISKMQELIIQEKIDQIIIGLPTRNGLDTDQTKWTLIQIGIIKESINIPINVVEEAYTSQESERILKMGTRFKKGNIDETSAALILEQYLHEQEDR